MKKKFENTEIEFEKVEEPDSRVNGMKSLAKDSEGDYYSIHLIKVDINYGYYS